MVAKQHQEELNEEILLKPYTQSPIRRFQDHLVNAVFVSIILHPQTLGFQALSIWHKILDVTWYQKLYNYRSGKT